jgi:hypothetical protein
LSIPNSLTILVQSGFDVSFTVKPTLFVLCYSTPHCTGKTCELF